MQSRFVHVLNLRCPIGFSSCRALRRLASYCIMLRRKRRNNNNNNNATCRAAPCGAASWVNEHLRGTLCRNVHVSGPFIYHPQRRTKTAQDVRIHTWLAKDKRSKTSLVTWGYFYPRVNYGSFDKYYDCITSKCSTPQAHFNRTAKQNFHASNTK